MLVIRLNRMISGAVSYQQLASRSPQQRLASGRANFYDTEARVRAAVRQRCRITSLASPQVFHAVSAIV